MIQKPFAAYIWMRGFGGLMRRQLAAALIVSVLGSTTVSAANDFPYGQTLAITAYRYIHSGREVWNGDTLQALDSETDDNGKKYKVHVQRGANGLTVERQAPADAINAS